MAEQPTFAFDTKPRAKDRRIVAVLGVDELGSDNVNYDAFAPPSAFVELPSASDRRPLSDALLAASDRLIGARFWSHVNRRGPVHPGLGTRCWLWTANCVGRGNKTHPTQSRHGQFTFRVTRGATQQHVFAHRFAWMIAHGAIPAGLCVLHRCDVPPCVNVAHHFLGTQADNMKDAAQKRRFTVPRTKSLTLAERLAIYQAPTYPGSDVALARQHGVSRSCIHQIRRGRFLGSGLWHGTNSEARS